jgi:hypothetical protein
MAVLVVELEDPLIDLPFLSHHVALLRFSHLQVRPAAPRDDTSIRSSHGRACGGRTRHQGI